MGKTSKKTCFSLLVCHRKCRTRTFFRVTLKDPLSPSASTAHFSHPLPGSAKIPGARGKQMRDVQENKPQTKDGRGFSSVQRESHSLSVAKAEKFRI